LDGIRDSFKRHAGATLEVPQADRATPAEIREKRRKARKKDKQEFQVVSHELHVRIDPPTHSLSARDRLTVESAKDGLSEIRLFYSLVSIDRVTGPLDLTWESKPPADDRFTGGRELVVRLGQPLESGKKAVLNVETSCSDFLQTIDQKLVTELAVFGQIREESSFSSHVAYYPVDERNDAAVDISLTVPSGYTAVTGGALVEVREADGWTTFRYRAKDRRHRLLPFGFAAGKFISESAESGGGLRLTFYGNPGEEEALRQRLDVAVEAAGIFERMMGPLPWKDVRFAHVTPVSKETGVSLPGLILISDMFFTDITEVDLSDGFMNKSDGLSLLIVADELSHQWNAYSVPLPNELAEGVSTFTNALFIEHRHGSDGYRNAIRFCREAYVAATALDRDVAIADPEIYETTAYRGIAFCKTPAILDMLRTRLGDRVFFAAWRKAFREFDTKRDGFDVLLEAFNETSGQDLTGFFDQWFFTAGWPKIRIAYSRGNDKLLVTLRQIQDGPPYHLRSELLVRGAAGEARRYPVTLSAAQTALELDCPFEPTAVVLDPDDRLLKEMVAK
jgi:aminopeptidase N